MEPEVVHLLLGGDGMETCRKCGREEPTGTLARCGVCGGTWHLTCKASGTKVGPWHCRACLALMRWEGRQDITLDQDLIEFLAYGEVPADAHALARVIRAAMYIRLDS